MKTLVMSVLLVTSLVGIEFAQRTQRERFLTKSEKVELVATDIGVAVVGIPGMCVGYINCVHPTSNCPQDANCPGSEYLSVDPATNLGCAIGESIKDCVTGQAGICVTVRPCVDIGGFCIGQGGGDEWGHVSCTDDNGTYP